jgi:hypothetical protein
VPAGVVFEQRPGAARAPLPDGYQRRAPERTVLYELVSAHREPLLRHMREVDPKGYGFPPPRRHLVRYHGLFGPAASQRKQLRRLLPVAHSEVSRCPDPTTTVQPQPPSSVWPARRVPWAELLKRVFGDDLLHCGCGGRRTVVAVVTDAGTARSSAGIRSLMEIRSDLVALIEGA